MAQPKWTKPELHEKLVNLLNRRTSVEEDKKRAAAGFRDDLKIIQEEITGVLSDLKALKESEIGTD